MGRKNLTVDPQRILNFLIELLLALTLAFSPVLFGSVGIFPLTIIELSALMVLFLWLLKLLTKGSVEFVAIPVNKPIIAFLIFIAVQYIFINFFIRDVTLNGVYIEKIKSEALRLVSYLIFFYAVLNNFQKRSKINRLIFFLFIIGFGLSILGITQKLSGAKNIFWVANIKSAVYFFASFPNRNHFANYINMIIFLVIGVVFSNLPLLRHDVRGPDKESIVKGMVATFQKWIWLYIFGLVIMISSTFFSESRGGIFSFLCGIFLFSALIMAKQLTKKGFFVLCIAFMLVVVMLFWFGAPKQIMYRFYSISQAKGDLTEKVLGSRKTLADSAIDLIKGYPIMGVGYGAIEFIYNKKYNPKLISGDGRTYCYIDHLHNDFLELFCEVGFIGFAIFLIGASLYVLLLFKTILKRHDPFVIGVGAGSIASLFSMCTHSFFDFNFHITSNALLFFVIAAMALIIANSHLKKREETNNLTKVKLLAVKNIPIRLLILYLLLVLFFNISKIIVNPYLAYRISEDNKASINNLIQAVKLDPLNDKYHFLLAKKYIDEAQIKLKNRPEYIDMAVKEVKEAMKLNPWNEYYPKYLDWIAQIFKP